MIPDPNRVWKANSTGITGDKMKKKMEKKAIRKKNTRQKKKARLINYCINVITRKLWCFVEQTFKWLCRKLAAQR